MKRNLLKKVTGVVLASTLVMGLAACGNEPASNQTSESEVKTTETAVSSETTVEPSEEVVDVTYPLEGAPKLTLWTTVQKLASTYTSYTESPYHMGMQENTGVEVEWQFPAQGAKNAEAYNLMLTEEVLPHMIGYATPISDAEILAQDGAIWDLTDYIPKYAPDYWEYLNSNPELLKAVKSDEGRIYGINAFTENDYNLTYAGPVIRQDWLDECGLQTPVTLEDWENVLVTFKEKYGALIGWANSRYVAGIASGTGAYASLSANFYVDENNQVKLGNMENEWKEMLEVLHKWFEMGLIDQDSFTMDDKAARAKVLDNAYGVSFTSMAQLTNWIADAEKENTGANWVALSSPRTATGAPTTYIQSGVNKATFMTMITTTCSEEEMITALKWLNYGFTEEGFMYQNYGTQGETYTLDADGKPQWTETITNDPDGIATALNKYTGTSSTAQGGIQAAYFVQIKNDAKAATAPYVWIENTVYDKHQFRDGYLSMTDDEQIVISDVYAPIKTYISEMALKFIMGEESIDNFDAFVAELKKMGIEDVLKVQQAAYDRFLAR